MVSDDEQALHDFVSSRYDLLRRSAFLMGGDWARADELTRRVLARVVADSRATTVDDPEAYAFAELMAAFRRRPGRRQPVFVAPPGAAGDLTGTLLTLAALHRLPPRRRAVLVLRHWAGFGVAETADVLGLADERVAADEAAGLAALPVPVR